jgi:hypothetical protein
MTPERDSIGAPFLFQEDERTTMEPIVYMSLGAAGVVSLICLHLAAKHGWA